MQESAKSLQQNETSRTTRVNLIRKAGRPLANGCMQGRFSDAAYREKFAQEFVIDFNGAQAAIRAGFVGRNPNAAAYDLLTRTDVKQKIEMLLVARSERLQISGDDIARHFFALATADARELCPIILSCCRHCYGIDHQYQFTLNEMRDARRAHIRGQSKIRDQSRRMPFDEKGGDGYDVTRGPNPACTECCGLGVNTVAPIDVTKLSPQAVLLLDGYKVSKDGTVTVTFRDRTRAMENLVEMLGLNRKRAIPHLNIESFTDAELDAAIEAALQRKSITQEQLDEHVTECAHQSGGAVGITA